MRFRLIAATIAAGISSNSYEDFQSQFQTTARSQLSQANTDRNKSGHQAHLTFASSNFFWENLEKTALTLSELSEVYLYKAPTFPEESVSVSGSTVAYPYVSSDTGIRLDELERPGSVLITQNHYSGSTMQSIF